MTTSPSKDSPATPASLPKDALPVRGILSIPTALTRSPLILIGLSVLLWIGALLSLPAWDKSIRGLLHSNTYSDVARQWYCCLYVRNGVDPFDAANSALERTYGAVQGPNRIRLKDVRIWSVNTTQYDDQTPGLLPGTPPPEAGYPPSSLAICLALFGYIPFPWLTPFWALLNLACFLGLIWFLSFPTARSSWQHSCYSLLMCAGCFLIWPTTRLIFAHGQFTFFSMLFALLGLHYRLTRPWLASILFSLALIKPALVLLFLIIPLLERNWRFLLGISIFHGLATLVIAGMIHVTPWKMLQDWMNICRYLLQGSYTFQEIYNALGWENTWIATTLTLVIFAYSTLVCWLSRAQRSTLLLTFLCFFNLMWTYHERHDFTLLVLPLMLGVVQGWTSPSAGLTYVRQGFWVLLFVLIGIGLSTPAYANLLPISHLLRWLGRIGIWSALIWINVEFWMNWVQSNALHKPLLDRRPI